MATTVIKYNDVGTHIFKWWGTQYNLRIEGMHPVFKGMKPRVDNIGDVAGADQCRRELGCKPRYRVECVVSNE